MTNPPINPIVKKIKKLLSLSQDQYGTPEGETAARLASRMMAAHAIEMATIDAAGDIDVDPLEQQDVKVRVSVWRRRLFAILGEHCNCVTAYVSVRGKGLFISMYGHRSDIEVLKFLYFICEIQIENEAKKYVASLPTYSKFFACMADGYTPGQKRKIGNDFRRSAVDGLATKLRDIREDTQEENAEGFALVRSRKQKVDQWVDETNNFKTGSVSDYDLNLDGYRAGRDVRLNEGIEAAESHTQIGSE